MNFVEWLRVRNVLRVVAIVLGLLIVLSLGLRIYFNNEISSDEAMLRHVQMQPGSTVEHTTLPDGTVRTTIHDPSEKTTVVMDNHGAWGRRIEITEPRDKADLHESHFMLGSMTMNEVRRGDMEITTIETDSRTPLVFYLAFALFAGLFVATALASPLARENDGHLEYALTKPASRELLALRTIGVDVAGIVLAEVMVIVALLVCQVMFEVPHLDASGANLMVTIMAVVAPAAWYAMILAATSSMKRGYGAVLGFAWPVALAVLGLTAWSAYWADNTFNHIVHNMLFAINHLNPLAYMGNLNINTDRQTGDVVQTSPSFGVHLAAECILFVIYSALAVFQWKRVEA